MSLSREDQLDHGEEKAGAIFVEDAAATGNHDEVVATIAKDLLPDVPLNLDPEFERKLVRKIDLRLLTMLMALYLLNYIDRGNITYAAVTSFKKDLKLNSTQYATLIAIFYAAYIPTIIPSNILIAKAKRPSLLMAGCMCAWAVVSGCQGATHSFGQAMATRIFLAITEAPFFAAAAFQMSCFYTKKELGKRVSILFIASFIAGIVSGLMAAGIVSGMEGKAGLPAWRWLFIIEGAINIPIAILALFVLPDYPQTTRWLSPEEKKLAVYRLAQQNVSTHTAAVEDEMTVRQALRAAVSDPSTWLLAFLCMSVLAASSYAFYLPTIVAGLGFKHIVSILLTAPPYAFVAFVSITNSWHADKTGERWRHICVGPVVTAVGIIIAMTTTNIGARYLAIFLILTVQTSYGIGLAWVQTSVPGPPLKKAVTYAIVLVFVNISPIWSSYLYPAEDGPRFLRANGYNLAMCCISLSLATIHRFRLKWLNKKLDQAEADDLREEGTAMGTRTKQLLKRYQIEPTYRYLL